jgi:hypothetical protein
MSLLFDVGTVMCIERESDFLAKVLLRYVTL